VTLTAPKPTAPPPLGARLRRRLPAALERRLPPWAEARPWVLLVAGGAAVALSTGAVWGANLVLELSRHPTVKGVEKELAPESDFATGPQNVLILGSDGSGPTRSS
jgi:hypothetical protein